ncbi:hypothetical protein JCM4814A_41600 [Streptomyces phaeofaciens JCM 4814]|uniref:Uncharacterized protein n=1 Tax=Streptomyces phaeofaciens TaxID=68254 RepID=A0A918HMB6_9ACTN|nr:hypothetical protein [Streptomyces phaeofaciens]GGT81044.1 hypothetical protein GCM10010226_69650 [Streptomyces phaeofaciens]
MPTTVPVKAVSDWGADRTDTAQPAAARNAAEFVIRMVSAGALDPHTWQTLHAD